MLISLSAWGWGSQARDSTTFSHCLSNPVLAFIILHIVANVLLPLFLFVFSVYRGSILVMMNLRVNESLPLFCRRDSAASHFDSFICDGGLWSLLSLISSAIEKQNLKGGGEITDVHSQLSGFTLLAPALNKHNALFFYSDMVVPWGLLHLKLAEVCVWVMEKWRITVHSRTVLKMGEPQYFRM